MGSIARTAATGERPEVDSRRQDGFVGRTGQLATLAQLHVESTTRGRVVLIEGVAGAGKSRLIERFLADARDVGLLLKSFCYGSAEAGPYFPFLQALNTIELAGRLPPDWQSRGLVSADWRKLSGDARGQRARFLKEVSRAILDVARSSKTVLVVEDLHWADVGSLLLLNALLDAGAPGLFVICSTRTDEEALSETLQLLARLQQGAHRMTLPGLDLEEVGDLVARLAGPGLLAPDELRDAQELTDGNPLFLRELVLHLQETGQLQRQTLREAVTEALPSRMLGDLIDARLSLLPSRPRATIEAASVVGREFSAKLVAQVMGQPVSVTVDDLAVAVAKGFLRPQDTAHVGSYTFAHPLIQTRLYQSLVPSTRRAWHKRVARAGANEPPMALAHHYALGFGREAEAEAVRYCTTAAEQSEGVLAYETAAHFWDLALSCTDEDSLPLNAMLQRRLGWALWAAGNWTRATDVWNTAAQLFGALGDVDHEAELALALGDMLRFRLDLPRAVHWLERALTLLPEQAAEQRARALALLGSIRCLDAPGHDGLDLLQRAYHAAPNSHVDPIVAYWLAYGFLVSGDEARAHAISAEAIEEAQRTGNVRAITLLAGGRIQYELTHLRPAQAEHYAQVLEAAVDTTDAATLSQSLLSRALVLGYAGRWHQVKELCECWMGQVRLAGRFQVATARLIWAEAALALGHGQAALDEMRRAVVDLDEMRPLAPLHLARALLAAGETQAAAETVESAAPMAGESPRFAAARAMLGDLASRLDDAALWKSSLESLANERHPMLVVYVPISVDRVRGRLAARLKRWALAVECFERALAMLGEGGATWELAQTYLDYADMRRLRRRRGDDTKANALKIQAARLLATLGIDGRNAATAGPANGNRFGLTGRELEVIDLLTSGLRNQEIADTLTLSRRTVERHLENIFVKMGVKSRAEAIVLAVEDGLAAQLAARTAHTERIRRDTIVT